MTEEEIKMHLKTLTDTNPVWKAIDQVFQQASDIAVERAVAGEWSAEDRAYECGRARGIADLHAVVNQARK